MATETGIGMVAHRTASVTNTTGVAPVAGSLIGRDAAGWVVARLADDNGEASFLVEADERYWRLRRVLGDSASMYEDVLALPASVSDLAAALVRWAHAAGYAARVATEPDAPVKVVVARRAD